MTPDDRYGSLPRLNVEENDAIYWLGEFKKAETVIRELADQVKALEALVDNMRDANARLVESEANLRFELAETNWILEGLRK